MKEYTNIVHNLKMGGKCERNLDKEFWGDGWFNMTCWKCGFAAVISEKTFLDWQYSDKVIEGGDKSSV
jgi:hypothetical protein